MQKKVAVVQDVSCYGKCSALVAVPIISAFGHEVHLLPTAVFSAHTGFEFHSHIDLTEFMPRVLSDWKKLNLHFDGVYSGYLMSEKQVENVIDLIDNFCDEDASVVVDPVIGDNGKAYSFLNEGIRSKMLKLVSKARVITPNLTEVAILLDHEPQLCGYDESYVKRCLVEFKGLGCTSPIITGISFKEDEIGVAYLVDDEVKYEFSKRYSGDFSGTGDTFASVIFSALVSGLSLESAVKKALEVLDLAIKDNDNWYGIDFEKAIDVV